jgi:hypothetical protein
LVVTSLSGSPLFSHGVFYQLLFGNYDGTFTQLNETLSNDPTDQLTGDVTISLSAVPTEYLNEDLSTKGTDYTFSFFSSSSPPLLIPSSATLQVIYDLPVPGYYYQVKDFQVSTDLQFVVGLISLAGGVITVGSVLANSGTFFRQTWRLRKSKGEKSGIPSSADDTQMSSL